MNRCTFHGIVDSVPVLSVAVCALFAYSVSPPPFLQSKPACRPVAALCPWPRSGRLISGRSSASRSEVPIRASADLSAEDRAGMFANAAVPLMPYLIQDNYLGSAEGCLPTIQVENAALRATFYPTLGGRMISLYDKRGQRELLFDNPVLQFANLAIRNAWFSGGVEWNGPLYGHSLLTCSPVFAGMVERRAGRCCESTSSIGHWKRPGKSTCSCRRRRPALGPRQGHQPQCSRRPLLLVDQHRRAADSRDSRAVAGRLRTLA